MKKVKVKVLFLTNIPSPYRVDFFNELGKLCDLTVLFEKKSSNDREKNWHSYNYSNFSAIFLNSRSFNEKSISFEVYKYLKEELFDVFVIGGYSTPTGILAIEIMKIKGIPFILNADGGFLKKEKKFSFFIKKYLIRNADYWLSSSENTSAYLKHYGALSHNTFIYPFTSIWERDILKKTLTPKEKGDYKKKLGINKEKKIVLSVGRFVYEKGYDVLIEAARHLPKDCEVYIIGGSPPDIYLNQLKEADLQNVKFLPFMGREELKNYYYASDLFVLPTRGDVWGLVINEAMANGLPIVTTDKCIAGLELVVNNTNGFIVPSDNPQKLSHSMNIILNDRQLMEDMSIKSLSRIQGYTIENMALRHYEIIHSILNER